MTTAPLHKDLRRRLGAACWPVLLSTAACSPTFDWRDVRPEGSGAQALFPCKPETQTRRVRLGGSTVEMTLLACDAGGVTFALAFADVGEPARVGGALTALGEAAQRNVDAPAAAASAVLRVPGMTAHPEAARLRFEGRRGDGSALQEDTALFAKGTRVFQATVIAPRAHVREADTFISGLSLSR